jgi:hypothetical protein
MEEALHIEQLPDSPSGSEDESTNRQPCHLRLVFELNIWWTATPNRTLAVQYLSSVKEEELKQSIL